MRLRRLAASVLAAALLGGCSIVGTSPKTQFYTLSPIAGMPPAAGSIAPIAVTEFRAPNVLDRNAMVRKTGPNRLDVEGTDRWGAPLGELARDALVQDLTDRLPQGAVVDLSTAQPKGRVRYLTVDAATFMPEPGGHTTLDVDWSVLSAPGAPPAINRLTRITVPGGSGGAADQARAMSEALAKLADEIAAALAAGEG